MGTSLRVPSSGSGAWRVSQLAKQLGVSSAVLLEVIRESGEYVRGPSSTIAVPVVRSVSELIRQRFPEAVLTATVARATTMASAAKAAKAAVSETATRPPREPSTFVQEAERLAATGPGRKSGSGGARRIQRVRVADLPPMARQLLRYGHGYHRPTVEVRFAETVKVEAVAWAQVGFDELAATPWIGAHIAPAAAGYLARHGITPHALDRRIPVPGQGEMLLSVAVRSGLVSPAQVCRILEPSSTGR
jgi:hypothetical protein